MSNDQAYMIWKCTGRVDAGLVADFKKRRAAELASEWLAPKPCRAAPSAAGEAAIDTLRSRGWTVTVTGGYSFSPALLFASGQQGLWLEVVQDGVFTPTLLFAGGQQGLLFEPER